MSMQAKVVLSSRRMDNLRRRLIKLAETKLQTGHFQESGMHPEAEISYADLAKHLQVTFPQRDLRIGVMASFMDTPFKNTIKRSTRDYIINSKPMGKSLDIVGSHVTDFAKGIFGIPATYNPSNSSWWAEVKGQDSPMLFEGHLRNSWAWKNTFDNKINYRRS